MTLPDIPAPPSALYPHDERLSVCSDWAEPLDPSDPAQEWGVKREILLGLALKGLVQVLKGALLPSGAGAWLLGAEEARVPLAPGRI